VPLHPPDAFQTRGVCGRFFDSALELMGSGAAERGVSIVLHLLVVIADRGGLDELMALLQ
jgi:hypothetical protein